MSYIQCVAIGSSIQGINPQVIITSDGRVCGENGSILQENYKKIDRINSKVAVAYAGNKYFCELIVKTTKQICNNLDNICIEEFHKNLTDISKNTFDNLNNSNLKCQFIVGGITNNNSLGILTLSTNNDFKITQHYVDSNNVICFASASSNSFDNQSLNDNLCELVSSGKILYVSDFYKVINDTYREVALIDDSVNTEIFREIIKL